MNLAAFFKNAAQKYNADKSCDFCWAFKKVKGESGLNSIRLTEEDECCVQLALTYQRKSYSERFNNTTTAVTRQFCDSFFTIYAVKASKLGTNYGNEIPGHDETESISENVIQPLFDCLTCQNIIDVCDLGHNVNIVQWVAEEVLFLGDQNFSGIKISGMFREFIN